MDECRKPGDARRIGMPAQFVWSLDRDPLAAALQITGGRMIEQTDRQVDAPDQLQRGQFLLHACKAGASRITAQPKEWRRRTVGHVDHLHIAQQIVKALADRRRQPRVDIRVKPLLMSVYSGPRDSLHSFDGRRFNRQFAAARFESLDHRRNFPAGLKCVGVGNGGFSKTESNANLGTDTFGRTACQEGFTIDRSWYVELPAEGCNPLRIDFGFLSWKAPVIAEEGQQDGETEPRFPALGHHQDMIGRRQSPRIVGRADAVRHATTSEFAAKWGPPIRARVSSNVVRLTPKLRQTAALDIPAIRAARTASSGGQPSHDAFACQSTLILGQRAAYMEQYSPDAVVVSIPSVSERKATCFSFSAFTMDSKCDSDRPSRSSLHTTSTSPGCTNASTLANPGRSSFAPEA